MQVNLAADRHPETNTKHSQVAFAVTFIAHSLEPLSIFGDSTHSLIEIPSTVGLSISRMNAEFQFNPVYKMMIAFIIIKSSLVPLIEGLCAQI